MDNVKEQSNQPTRWQTLSVRAFVPTALTTDDLGQDVEAAFVETTKASLPMLKKALGAMREVSRKPRQDADDLKRFILAKFGPDALAR